MSYTNDTAAYLKWAKSVRPDIADFMTINSASTRFHGLAQSNFHYDAIDHGFIIDGACCLADTLDPRLDGVENAIVARLYSSDEQIAKVTEGLVVIELPYPVDNGRPFMLFPYTDGAGTRDFLYAVSQMDACYFSYALPRDMHDLYHLALRPNGMNDVRVELLKKGGK